jgi:hypothetical protein
MNGKRAKAIRRLAQSKTIGKNECEYAMRVGESFLRLKSGCTRKKCKELKKESNE